MEIQLSTGEKILRSILQHYNHERYWNWRADLIDPNKGTRIGDMIRLLYIKRSDAFNNATMGTHRNFGASFATPPQLPHGLYGIVVSHNAKIGRNCKIFHQVTIGEGRGGAPVIGDDVVIGAGSKIVGSVRVGNHVSIAPGCVIMQDIPDNAVVLPGEVQIRMKQKGETNEP